MSALLEARGISYRSGGRMLVDVVDRIATEFVKATHDPKFVAQLEKYGATPFGLMPDAFAKFLKEDMAMWAEAVKIAGVKLPSKSK